ncbi:MAG TPA: MFS transporter [Baekduia sp.]|nr:MFS transporter [Baekduia sp.]
MSKLAFLTPNLAPWRSSKDYRRLVTGHLVSSIGTQAVLVALPFQIYIETRSAFLTGLLGAAELGPMVLASLLGGAFADRHDRRILMLYSQWALLGLATALAVLAFVGDPPIWTLFVLGGLLAGAGALENVTRSAMVPNLVPPELVREALAFWFGLTQVTMIVGPLLAGVIIATLGLGAAYTVDAVSCLAVVWAAYALPPQFPKGQPEEQLGIGRSISEGLVFIWRNKPLTGSFAMDLCAMTFGMPRALFPALAVGVYGAGASGSGLLFASVAFGSSIFALATGWISHVRRLGVILAWSIVVWGLAIAAAGFAGSIWLAAGLFAIAGGADSVGAVCRVSINQLVTPDALRGRMSSVFSLVVTSGPRLGDVESGVVASLAGVRASVVSGGLACVAGVGLVALAFPGLMRFNADDYLPGGSKHIAVAADPEPVVS